MKQKSTKIDRNEPTTCWWLDFLFRSNTYPFETAAYLRWLLFLSTLMRVGRTGSLQCLQIDLGGVLLDNRIINVYIFFEIKYCHMIPLKCCSAYATYGWVGNHRQIYYMSVMGVVVRRYRKYFILCLVNNKYLVITNPTLKVVKHEKNNNLIRGNFFRHYFGGLEREVVRNIIAKIYLDTLSTEGKV